MPWLILARCAAIVATVAVPTLVAQPGAVRAAEPEAARPGDEAISFEEYRNWRLVAMERRRSEIDVQLSVAELPDRRKARLEDTRAYYNWLAGLPEAERDRRFRERFDRIDANHDGALDPGERAAWRERQRAYYGGGRKADEQRAGAATPGR